MTLDKWLVVADKAAGVFFRSHFCHSLGDLDDVRQLARLASWKFVQARNPNEALLFVHVSRRLCDALRKATHARATDGPTVIVSSPVVELAAKKNKPGDPVEFNDLLKILSSRLGDRERIVLTLLAEGLSQADVARRLAIGRSTICRRVGTIRRVCLSLNLSHKLP